jgi:hypothetical protein
MVVLLAILLEFPAGYHLEVARRIYDAHFTFTASFYIQLVLSRNADRQRVLQSKMLRRMF